MNAQMFSVLAEPNRLDIIEFLYKNPHTVNEIVGRLHLKQPQVSKHLRVLADAGVVDVHPVKNQRIYALKPQAFEKLEIWLDKYRNLWEVRFDRLDKVLKAEKRKVVNKNGR